MILEERLTDKMSYISLLEGKLEQKNSKMTFMQDEIKKQSEYRAELEKQVLCWRICLHKEAFKVDINLSRKCHVWLGEIEFTRPEYRLYLARDF